MSARNLKLIGAAGATALAVSVAMAPAHAVSSDVTASTTYTCHIGLFNADSTPTADFDFVAPPAKLVAGQKKNVATNGTVFTLDIATTGLVGQTLGWASFDGTIKTTPSDKAAGLALTIPKTTVGAPGSTTPSTPTGSMVLSYSTAGKKTLKLGNLGAVHLQGYDSSGNPLGGATGSADFPSSSGNGQCKGGATLQAGASAATVAVSKDASKTTTKASWKKGTVSSSAKVAGSKYKLAGTGKVKFTLKKGSKTIKSATGSLKKGTAKVSFKNVKAKGSYTVTAKFSGDGGLKGSSGKASFKIK